MKKIIYIATIGSDARTKTPNLGPITSGLSNIAPNSIHKVYFLSDLNKKTIISTISTQFPYLNKKTEHLSIDIFNYETLMEAVLKIYGNYPKDSFKYIINITGGTKIMSLGAFMGAILIGAEVQYIKESKEKFIGEQVIEITMPKIPIYEIHPIQKCILLVLKNVIDVKDIIQSEVRKVVISDYAGKKEYSLGTKKELSPQIISYHCKILEKNGLIIRTHDDANRRVQILTLTLIGNILAKFIFDEIKK